MFLGLTFSAYIYILTKFFYFVKIYFMTLSLIVIVIIPYGNFLALSGNRASQDRGIRTLDLLIPNQAEYQAVLYPDSCGRRIRTSVTRL